MDMQFELDEDELSAILYLYHNKYLWASEKDDGCSDWCESYKVLKRLEGLEIVRVDKKAQFYIQFPDGLKAIELESFILTKNVGELLVSQIMTNPGNNPVVLASPYRILSFKY